MKSDLSSSFKSPHFKKLLTQYEEMIRQHTSIYFEGNELTLLAEYYASRKMVSQSKEVLQYALSIHPDNLDIQLYLCHTLLAEGKLAEAEKILNSLSDQEDSEVNLLRATIYLEKNELEKAEEIFMATSIQPENSEDIFIFLDIADIYMDFNMGEQAYTWLKKAYKKEQNNMNVWESLFDFHYTFGNINRAILYCNKLLDENSYEIDYWLNLTRCYIKQLKFQEALEAVDFALAIDENHLTALELKGLCYIQLGEMEKGCKCFSAIENSSPNRDQIYQVISECYFSVQNYEKSIEYLTKCLNIKSLSNFEYASTLQKRALAYLFLNELDLCKKDIDLGISYDEQYDYLYLALGEYYILQGEEKKAQREMSYAEALASDKKEIKIEIANIYYRNEKFDEALTYYIRLEKEYPNFMPAYQYIMACCYYRKNDEQNTIKYLVKALHSSDCQNYTELIKSIIEKEGALPQLVDKLQQMIKDGLIDPHDFSDEESVS